MEASRRCDCVAVGLITTCAICAYHNKSCEFKFHSGEVYSIQHYVIRFVSDFRLNECFSPGTPVAFTNKTDRHNVANILLKVAFNTINQT